MRKVKLFLGNFLAAAMIMAVPMVASAMPADIEEAVTAGDYNAYEHVGGSSYYDEADLIPVHAYYVATAEVMVRTSPFGDIIGSLTPGQVVYVEGKCPDCMWYKISDSLTGYVYASYLVPQSQYSAPSASTNNDPAANYNIRSLNMYMTVTATDPVNVRSGASQSYSVIGTVKPGDEVHVTGNVLNTEWYQCEFNGQTAYICDDFVLPELPQNMACTIDGLCIRSAASTDAEILGSLRKGDVVKVSAVENDWLKFSLADGRIGYAYDEYMAVV